MTSRRLSFAATLDRRQRRRDRRFRSDSARPPPMTSVLAGKKCTPPFKGQADHRLRRSGSQERQGNGDDYVSGQEQQ
jgi:hypothetical protein